MAKKPTKDDATEIVQVDKRHIVGLVLALEAALDIGQLDENIARLLIRESAQTIRHMRPDLTFSEAYS